MSGPHYVPTMGPDHLYQKVEKLPTPFQIAKEKLVRWTFDEENEIDVNPWNVSDASEFLRYQCPECQFQSRTLDKFSGHAVLNHIKASKLFRNVKPNKKVANDALVELNQEVSCLERYENDAGKQVLPTQSMKVYGMTDEERLKYIQHVMSENFVGANSTRVNNPAKYKTVVPKVQKAVQNMRPLDKQPKVNLGDLSLVKEIKKQKGVVFPTVTEESSDIEMVTKPEPQPEPKIVEEPVDVPEPEPIDPEDVAMEAQDESNMIIISTKSEEKTETQDEPIAITAKPTVPKSKAVKTKDKVTVTESEITDNRDPLETPDEGRQRRNLQYMTELFGEKEVDIDANQILFEDIDNAEITFAEENFDPNAVTIDAEEVHIGDGTDLSIGQIVDSMEKEDVLLFQVQKPLDQQSNKYNEFNDLMDISETEMKCKECPDEVFDKKFKLVNHLMTKHGSSTLVPTEICQFCVEVFSTSKAFGKHMTEKHSHRGVPHLKYKCRLCEDNPKELFSLQSLLQHVRTVHLEYNYQPYKCDQCPMQFLIEEEYLQHLSDGHDHKSVEFTCKKCPVVNRSRKNYMIHQHLHGDAPNLAFCEYCDFTTEDGELELIEHHHNNHTMEMPPLFMCDKCEHTEKHVDAMKRHCAAKHNDLDIRPFMCSQCEMTSKTFNGLKVHYQAAHAPKKRICETCKASFETPEELNQHIGDQHADIVDKLICDQCAFDTYVVDILRKHRQKHNRSYNRSKQRIKCPHCPKEFTGKYRIEIHIDRMHPESGEHNFGPCEYCAKTFIYERTFKDHKYHCKKQEYAVKYRQKVKEKVKRIIAGGEPHPMSKYKEIRKNMATVVKCDYCPETLKGGYLIKNHYAEKHPGMEILLPNVEKFLCKEDGCDTIFFGKSKMEAHQLRVHGKRFDTTKKQCPKCKMEYKDKHSCQYSQYELDRLKNQNCECQQCSRTFPNRAELRRHIRKAHESLNLKCPEPGCNKTFATEPMLKKHVKDCHRPVDCDLCGKQIVNAYEYRRHKVLVHNITAGAYTCRLCPKSVLFSEKEYERHMSKNHTGYKQVRKRLRID